MTRQGSFLSITRMISLRDVLLILIIHVVSFQTRKTATGNVVRTEEPDGIDDHYLVIRDRRTVIGDETPQEMPEKRKSMFLRLDDLMSYLNPGFGDRKQVSLSSLGQSQKEKPKPSRPQVASYNPVASRRPPRPKVKNDVIESPEPVAGHLYKHVCKSEENFVAVETATNVNGVTVMLLPDTKLWETTCRNADVQCSGIPRSRCVQRFGWVQVLAREKSLERWDYQWILTKTGCICTVQMNRDIWA